MRLPPTLRHVAEAFARLPSIGPRQAIRMAVYLSSLPRDEQDRLAKSLADLENVSRCVECGFPYEGAGDHCEICADPNRSAKTLMVVEKETDLLSLEKTAKYHGRYLVLGMLPRGGTLSPKQQERLASRAEVAKAAGGLDELILGLSASPAGAVLGEAVTVVLGPLTQRITQLGRGLPRGGEIEFADEDTLGYSLDSRH